MKENKKAATFKVSSETLERLEKLAAVLSVELGFKVSRSAAVELAIKEALASREREVVA